MWHGALGNYGSRRHSRFAVEIADGGIFEEGPAHAIGEDLLGVRVFPDIGMSDVSKNEQDARGVALVDELVRSDFPDGKGDDIARANLPFSYNAAPKSKRLLRTDILARSMSFWRRIIFSSFFKTGAYILLNFFPPHSGL